MIFVRSRLLRCAPRQLIPNYHGNYSLLHTVYNRAFPRDDIASGSQQATAPMTQHCTFFSARTLVIDCTHALTHSTNQSSLTVASTLGIKSFSRAIIVSALRFSCEKEQSVIIFIIFLRSNKEERPNM
eukprot:GHVU01012388.1.p2 GENE.GHVU01012388.1~~GHVU01012388.1.p2  ORF type:complete len:128 (+),score=1.58 GHVU01012388.1:505-888(+)